MADPLAIVAGAGSGLGQSLVHAFGEDGYNAIGLNRTVPDGGAVRAVDLSDAAQTVRVLADLIGAHGAPKLVVHNTAKLVISAFEDTSDADFEACMSPM